MTFFSDLLPVMKLRVFLSTEKKPLPLFNINIKEIIL
jgi:hypothetical protein